MPRVERRTRRRKQRHTARRKPSRRRRGQGPRQHGRHQRQQLVLEAGRGRSRRGRLRLRRIGRRATTAAGVRAAHDTGRLRPGLNDRRPGEHEAANNGQCRFHGLNLTRLVVARPTILGEVCSILAVLLRRRGFVRRFDLLDVLRGILVEILPAMAAAEFDLAVFVGEDVGLAHFA